MHLKTPGVVLRAVDYKESDRILTVLTEESGLMTVKARGCRRKNSPLTAVSEPFVYSQMTLFEYRDYYTLQEAEGLQQFWGVRQDVEKLALAAYCADVAQTVGVENEPNGPLLSLFLNTLYALDKLDKPLELLRAGFDLKAMAVAGYAPLLDVCAVCGAVQPAEPMWNLQAGVLHCRDCRAQGGEGTSLALTGEMLSAARHILYGDPRRLFSFRLPESQLPRFAALCSAYLTTQLERGFRTLDFYLELKDR